MFIENFRALKLLENAFASKNWKVTFSLTIIMKNLLTATFLTKNYTTMTTSQFFSAAQMSFILNAKIGLILKTNSLDETLF